MATTPGNATDSKGGENPPTVVSRSTSTGLNDPSIGDPSGGVGGVPLVHPNLSGQVFPRHFQDESSLPRVKNVVSSSLASPSLARTQGGFSSLYTAFQAWCTEKNVPANAANQSRFNKTVQQKLYQEMNYYFFLFLIPSKVLALLRMIYQALRTNSDDFFQAGMRLYNDDGGNRTRNATGIAPEVVQLVVSYLFFTILHNSTIFGGFIKGILITSFVVFQYLGSKVRKAMIASLSIVSDSATAANAVNSAEYIAVLVLKKLAKLLSYIGLHLDMDHDPSKIGCKIFLPFLFKVEQLDGVEDVLEVEGLNARELYELNDELNQKVNQATIRVVNEIKNAYSSSRENGLKVAEHYLLDLDTVLASNPIATAAKTSTAEPIFNDIAEFTATTASSSTATTGSASSSSSSSSSMNADDTAEVSDVLYAEEDFDAPAASAAVGSVTTYEPPPVCDAFPKHIESDSLFYFGVGKQALIQKTIPIGYGALVLAPGLGLGVLWLNIEGIMMPFVITHATGSPDMDWVREVSQLKAYISVIKEGFTWFFSKKNW